MLPLPAREPGQCLGRSVRPATDRSLEVRHDKQRAVETQEFEAAAGLRDEERGLVAALTEAAVPPAVIASIRVRLGLSPKDGDPA